MEEFVILYHQMPGDMQRPSHWDLMLQSEQELLTWALESDPFESSSQIPVQQLPNHRLEYLNFEGEIRGGRGKVTQIAKGHYRWNETQDSRNWLAHLFLQNGAECLVKLSNNQTIWFEWAQT